MSPVAADWMAVLGSMTSNLVRTTGFELHGQYRHASTCAQARPMCTGMFCIDGALPAAGVTRVSDDHHLVLALDGVGPKALRDG